MPCGCSVLYARFGEDLYSHHCSSDVHTCKEASMAVIQISMLYQYVEDKQYVEVWN